MSFDLNETLAFLQVVQEGSFTAAARALHQPKTTVSRRVRELEARIGAQLLHRTTRRLSLTDAGALYYEHCKDITSKLQDAENAVGQLQSGPRGWLRVTLPYSWGISWIAPMLAGFRARYPDLRLEILASHAPLDLVKENLDVALRLGVLPDSSLIAVRLGTFPTGLYASPDYLVQHGVPDHPEALTRHHTLTLHQARTDAGYAWPLSHHGEPAQRFPVQPVMVASDPEFLRPALYAGEGITLAMHASMKDDIESGKLSAVLADWSGPEQAVHAVYPQSRVMAPKVRAFVDYVRAYACCA
ncbi:LysR family transcriptional regulator [Allopusillimonas ginsengisoli]|uniref:LysR family transcriptional regulator n=1 Tax=Allopusillimonas ginsengisoli TaxID=453575 RepID=UPI00101EE71E|nr:LysR family transcriptional regulator [Allopusillimonas ginsengisoli]TEA80166.1 LysR family transcriptional regulator [Allopusillimonas ginsengisoli]